MVLGTMAQRGAVVVAVRSSWTGSGATCWRAHPPAMPWRWSALKSNCPAVIYAIVNKSKQDL